MRALFRAGGIPLNTVLVTLRIAVLTVIGIVMLPLLIDRIGTAPTGLFVFATTLTGYFTAIELGLATSVTKYTAQLRTTGEREHLNSVLRGSLLLMVAIGGIVALVLTVIALAAGEALFDDPAVRGEAVATLLVAAAMSFAYWPARLGPAALEGLERYDLRSVVGIVIALANLGGLLLLTRWTQSTTPLVAYFGGLLVLEGVICAALAWPHLGITRGAGHWRGSHLKEVLGFGSALFIIGMADTLIYAFDRTIVAAFVGAAGIVVYEVALRPHNGVRAISALTGSALLSPATRLIASGQTDRIRHLVFVGSFLGIILTTPIVVLIMVLAKPLLHVWVGDDFTRYAVYLQLFVSYWLIHANTSVLGTIAAGGGRLKPFVIMTVIGALATVAISIPMTAAFGTIGVIWGIVIPNWVGLPVWMTFALKRAHVTWSEYLRRVVAPAYGMLALWTVPVILAKQVAEPATFAGIALFVAVALAAFWGAALPPLRARWSQAMAVTG
jgi:O-antigen/teichoic acid export membrane protein